MILWERVSRHSQEAFVDHVSRSGEVLRVEEAVLNKNQLRAALYQIYFASPRMKTFDKIEQKADYLAPGEFCSVKVVHFRTDKGSELAGSQAPLKTLFRQVLLDKYKEETGGVVRGDDLLHVTDTEEEYHIVDCLWKTPQTLHFLGIQDIRFVFSGDQSIKAIDQFRRDLIARLGPASPSRAYLMAGSSLFIHGIRLSDDIDAFLFVDKGQIPAAKPIGDKYTDLAIADQESPFSDERWHAKNRLMKMQTGFDLEERAQNAAESVYFLGLRVMNTEDTYRYIFAKGRFTFSFKNLCDCFAMSRALKRPFKFKLYGPDELGVIYRKGWDRLGYTSGLGKAQFEDFFELYDPPKTAAIPSQQIVEDIIKQLGLVKRRYGSVILQTGKQVLKAKKKEDSVYLVREYAFMRFMDVNTEAVVPRVHFMSIHPQLSIMSLERMDGDCQEWLKHPHSDREWLLLLAWSLYATYTMDIRFGIIHQDFVYRNICHQKCEEDYSLVVEGHAFELKQPGVRFRTIDFETACFSVSDTCRVKCSSRDIAGGVKYIQVLNLIEGYSPEDLAAVDLPDDPDATKRQNQIRKCYAIAEGTVQAPKPIPYIYTLPGPAIHPLFPLLAVSTPAEALQNMRTLHGLYTSLST